MVRIARITASPSSAGRQPQCWRNPALIGMKMVLASAPARVTMVSAGSRWSVGNQRTTAPNAGS